MAKASDWIKFFEKLGFWVYDPQAPVADSLSPRMRKAAESIPDFDPYAAVQFMRADFMGESADELGPPLVPVYFHCIGPVFFTFVVDETNTCWITDRPVEDLAMHGFINLGAPMLPTIPRRLLN